MTPKRKPATSEAPVAAMSLPELCTEAADHVARARLSLHDETYDADRALRHLDDAILCLKRLLTKGQAHRGHAARGDSANSDLRSA